MIERGTGLSDIAEQLHDRGLISSKWIFIAGVRASAQQEGLKAGERVVTDGQLRLVKGAKVEIKTSPTRAEAPKS